MTQKPRQRLSKPTLIGSSLSNRNLFEYCSRFYFEPAAIGRWEGPPHKRFMTSGNATRVRDRFCHCLPVVCI